MSSTTIQLNNKKTVNGWAFFDWANSAYALVITTAIFPNYYMSMTNETIRVLGFDINNSSLYAFAISGSYLTVSFLLPLLSGMADYSGRRMSFMRLFTWIGSLSCLMLFFFTSATEVGIGLGFFMLATIGFEGGKVFYNSYLPLISSEDQYDRISAKGFAYGYIGSVILLMINLAMLLHPEWFGLRDGGLAARVCFVMVGLWWIGFAQIPFKRLPQEIKQKLQGALFRRGLLEIKSVWKELKPQRNIRRFLISFFCYSAGVQTVIFLAATFAEKELQFDATELIVIVLILQLVAIGGAYAFAALSKWRGNKLSLIGMLLIWISICFMAYGVTEKLQFYLVAALVGLVMGGIQSLSRSTYSKLIEGNNEKATSYFSFYEVLEKLAIVFGTASFGFIDQISGGMRNSVLVLAIYFIIGLLILLSVQISSRTTPPALTTSDP
ncbi:MAG: MFS transporter [Saprospiraceae bacterium]|nr:MFS transporter [Saprospiraceae bacterium]